MRGGTAAGFVRNSRDYSVITLRPGTRARYSTNRFHETWHVLSDLHGARLLGRLLWGLSFQRLPGTVIVIDRPHLDPNPFDAEPADPIVLVPAHLTTLTAQAIRRLRRRVAEPSQGTVRWQTWGLDAELARMRERVRECREFRRWPGWEPPAADASNSPLCWGDGEVQIFSGYRRRVAVAGISRREVLADVPEGSAPADVHPRIWCHNGTVRVRGGVNTATG